jgi:[ribosomal protein S5]-alanine N-acetyltransferase
MLVINFHPFQILETERLVLRRLTASDSNEIIELRGNPETMKFIPRPLITNHEEAIAFLNVIDENIDTNLAINWAITIKGADKMIGIAGIYRIQPENYRGEIGYMIMPQYHNKGYVTEAAKAITDFGFNQLNLNSIEAVIAPENSASEKVLIKNGYTKEGHFIEKECYNGVFLDNAIYTLLKRNFKQ